MGTKNNSKLFYTCSLIEFIGRKKKRTRREIVDTVTEGIWEVYHSWIDESISDYNTDFYFQPRDYIAACYIKGTIL